ncbi:hypothetical protein KEM52_003393 [Ascosphaera acerosa]|nr:hypothetical protein KEM52_003393 [Ascosphaera acerosa]
MFESRPRFSAASLLEDVLYESGGADPGRKHASRLLSNCLPPETAAPMDNFGLDKKRLEHESSVTEPGLRLVDTVAFAADYGLWGELLNHQRRMYGAVGVVRIFRGMRARDVDVPTSGAHGDYFWRQLVDAGLWGPDGFMDELVAYARELHARTGRRWQPLYAAVVGTLLESNLPGMATQWHNALKEMCLQQPNEILAVFPSALTIANGLRTFRRLVGSVPGHRIHREVVPVLWQQRRPMDAITMHRFLSERGDGPDTLQEVEDLLRYAEHFGFRTEKEILLRSVAILTESPYEETLRFVAEHGVDALTQRVREGHQQTGDSDEASDSTAAQPPTSSTAPSPYQDHRFVRQKKFSDELGARVFATHAFKFDLILSGLKVFGVSEIGPCSLREMACRAKSAAEVRDNIAALEDAGISLGTSVFSLTVKRLARDGADRILRDLVHSDQHPDALEDQDLQERLLMTYTREQDWAQVQRTMAVLTTLTDAAGSHDPHLHNIRLRQALQARDLSACRLLLRYTAAEQYST